MYSLMLLIKIINNDGPKTDSWGTSQYTAKTHKISETNSSFHVK